MSGATAVIESDLRSPAVALEALTAEQRQAILHSAVRVLAAATGGDEIELLEADLLGAADVPVLGAFVSVKRKGRLRGCCGFLGQNVPLRQALAHAARRTASDDHRFPPVALRELAHLDVEVWLLANQQEVRAAGEARRVAIEIGKHGLQIARGQSRGLLLPGVATEHALNAEQFLEHVCLKAELHATAWREEGTTLWTFEGHSIRAPLAEVLSIDATHRNLSLTPHDLAALAAFCGNNLLALLAGATPSYFDLGLVDGDVNGLAISLLGPDGNELLQGNRLSLKERLPLQSTLFAMTEGMAQALRRMNFPAERLRQMRLGLTVLSEPSLHGVAAAADLAGIDPARHMVLVLERDRTAGFFDPAQTPDALLAQAVRAAQIAAPEHAQVVALECLSSLPRTRVVNVPRPLAGTEIRPPAVAGRFYPADPAELAELIERCLPKQRPVPRPVPAVMVPHAGLIYSGHIAAQTLARVAMPRTAIVIGPKHTRHGLEWTVAPHVTWSIPGASLASDPALAEQLSQAIPGLQRDAAAHAQEHAIEVELPIIARLAPKTRVVGIAIGGGDLARCRRFAAGLAQVIQSLPEAPLLIISSDMNHYASDAETRRLDEMALAAMETLDPERLYQTVTSRHISMCGLLPAVIVMETLRLLGKLTRVERVAYGTSGDVSGDKARVVGYAGLLLGS